MGRPEERVPFADLANVKDRLLARGLKPRKKWGQNFLTRPDVAQRIVEACGIAGEDVVLEIGPGAGAITGRLAQRARHVVAVEYDRGLADLLDEDLGDWGRVTVVRGDILDVALADVCAGQGVERVVVVGNVPYAITTPILEWLIAQRAHVAHASLLVQREYAARLAAAPASPEYGSLTLYARYALLLEPMFHVPPQAFWPRPAVDSTLVRLRFRDVPPVDVPDEHRLFTIVRASFQQRRKTLANALLPLYGFKRERVERLLRAAHVAGERRGETLDLEEFGRIARHDPPFREQTEAEERAARDADDAASAAARAASRPALREPDEDAP